MNIKPKTAVVVLNWNGEEDSLNCISALKKQTTEHTIVAVDNNSSDNFVSVVADKYPEIVLLQNDKNKGFAGGVNTGIRYAIENNFDYVALINNDATPNPTWLENLLALTDNPKAGIVTGKLLKTDGMLDLRADLMTSETESRDEYADLSDGNVLDNTMTAENKHIRSSNVSENSKSARELSYIDSTGDLYTSWGLAYPRGRNEADAGQYDHLEEVFGATGGASLYRVAMLQEIGLFDEDFFAYYEDVDLSFRAQLAGWKVIYTPKAIAYHKIGASSGKVPGLTTYMNVKNMPWLFWKNVPWRLVPTVWLRFFIAHNANILSALAKGKIVPVAKGVVMSFWLFPKKLIERHRIQKNKKVSDDYIKSIVIYDLPPNAHKLKKIRSVLKTLRFWK